MEHNAELIGALIEALKQRKESGGGGFGFFDESGQSCDSLPDADERRACTIAALGRIRDEAPSVIENLGNMPKDDYREAMYRLAELQGEAEGRAKLAAMAALERGDYAQLDRMKRALQPSVTPTGELITGPYQWATGQEEPLIPSAYTSMGAGDMASKMKQYEDMLRLLSSAEGRQAAPPGGASVSDLARVLSTMATANAYGDKETVERAKQLYDQLLGGASGPSGPEAAPPSAEGGAEDDQVAKLKQIIEDKEMPLAIRLAAQKKLLQLLKSRNRR